MLFRALQLALCAAAAAALLSCRAAVPDRAGCEVKFDFGSRRPEVGASAEWDLERGAR